MNDYDFHIETRGNSKNTPLLFLHGFMGNGDDFQTIISQFAEDFYCLAIDLPGHGKTEINGRDDCYKMEQTGNAIAEFLDNLNLLQCYLLGYSMGGRLALYLALHFPQKFPKIILESASPGLKTPLEQEKRREKDAQLASNLETRSLENFLKDWYQNPLFSSLQSQAKFETKFEIMIQRRRQNDPLLLAKSLRYMGTGQQPSLWDELKTLQNPLLLLVGELDAKFTAIATQMQTLSPLIQLQIVENCGHNIHLENPEKFIKKVKYFLNAS
ncbi:MULTISPECIES: 2-succinyl-6-hydroxy-2,4-cyclohexadiene-1-carboxylate synthase [Spirulina sp. CCY15215]|uniref:2-succinyl-6-hydroxy-2, 4-cyclohexadiene-1-carboxylate synthase n=1 Tax=Spirulina sp. CCY15215 TaxID=2767591 RepID=UPI00194EE997|nr:2-succinyl-6-hydroxy-2,4-cyclohexadiene-1-carboxylate synthase [Spirulina major]